MAAIWRACVVVGLVTVVGCGPSKPDHGQALTNYKTELDLLDRLEKKRAEAQEQHDAFWAEQNGLMRQMSPDAIARMERTIADKHKKLREGFAAEIAGFDAEIEAQRRHVDDAAAVLKETDKKPSKAK